MKLLTGNRLRQVLVYDKETGVFKRFVKSRNCYRIAGRKRIDGYVDIMVDSQRVLAHRLAWLYVTGSWPKEEIDHKNTIKNDNKWGNLRESTRNMNAQNIRKPRKDNALGILGVSKDGPMFKAQICLNGKRIFIGNFSTVQQAHAAYVSTKRILHGGNTL